MGHDITYKFKCQSIWLDIQDGTVNDRESYVGGEVDEPMQHPWTFVIGLEADSDIIPRTAHADDIASNRIYKVICFVPCTSNNGETLLNSKKVTLVQAMTSE